MSQPPFGPPPGGGPSQPDGSPVTPPIPPGPGVRPGFGQPSYAAPGSPPDHGSPQYGAPGHEAPEYGSRAARQQYGSPPQQPSWQQLPPEQLARMHQPGVIPLRPLTLGDIFGGALQTMRRNPEATIGMGLIVLAVLLVPSLLLTLLATRAMSGADMMDVSAGVTLINLAFSMLSSVALTGMIVHVVGEAVLGDRASLSHTWTAVRGRLPALVGTILLIGLMFTVIVIAMIVAITLVAVATLESGSTGALAIIAIILVGVLAVGLIIWAGCRLSLAPAAVVLEQVGPWRGIARAWTLTKGRAAFRVLGITLLAGIVTGLFATVIQLPVVALMTFGLESANLSGSPLSPTVMVTDHLLQLVVGAVTIPFTAGVTALLYLDLRMRREGLDVGLARAAHDRASARNS